MARVYQGGHVFLTPAVGCIERFVYRITGIRADEEMDWKTYAVVMLLFNIAGLLLVYALQRLQAVRHGEAVPAPVAVDITADLAAPK